MTHSPRVREGDQKVRMHAVLSVLLVVSVFGSTRAAAQQTTGDIQGRVLGVRGQPLSDVQVIVTGPSLQGERQTLSDARGRFIFSSVPAGSYAIALRRIGNGPVRFQDVPVRLGSTTSLGDIYLEAQAVEVAEVIVSGAKPVIDPVSTATGATLDSSRFLSLPSGRDFRALIPFVPQANASPYSSANPYYDDGVNIAGSTGLENAFYVDGMNVTVLTGHSIDLPFNFVREIRVTTGGYGAEYGRALSGVINVVTPSGGNEFHGQAIGSFSADELRTAPRLGSAASDPVNFNQYDMGLSLSGPIRRDRLWYSVAYNPTSANQDVALASLPKQRGMQAHHLFAGKLTGRVGTGTDVALTVLGDPYTHDRFADYVLPSTTDPNVALVRETGGGTTVAVQARHEFSPRTQLSVAVSRLDRHLDQGPRSGSTSLQALTRIDDYTTNASSGGTGLFDQAREARTAVRVAMTLIESAHSVKLGAEYEDNLFSDSGTLSTISRSDAAYDWGVNSGFSRTHDRVPTLYVEDVWGLNRRLRVSAGVRWEAQHLSGEVGPPRTVASEIAPRFGVVYELGKLGSQRLFASAGRFFEQVAPLALEFWNGSGEVVIREYPQNPLVDSTNGATLLRFGFVAPATRGLVGQYYDQVNIGYERRLGDAFKIGAHGTYRVLRWVLEDGTLPGDPSVNRMGNPGRGPLAAMPRARQRYAALELSVERSTPGPLYLLASYVLSRNVGNYTGLFATDLMYGWPNSGPQYDVPDLMINAYGLLPNDRTHVAKAAASYRLGFGATLGGFLTVASGTPLSEYGTSAAGAPYWTFVRPRGSAGRTPPIWSLDLHAAYDLPFARDGRVRPRLLLDVFNVGSPRRALLYDQLHYTDNAQTSVNPNYGAVTRYQPPMSARIGMVMDF
jgi:hypothetical protein